ncbi:carbamoyltransferase [Candidatus Pelagibacter sp.]|nr:carbamoyltransferase [Candidatus Pelagibacter sp.]
MKILGISCYYHDSAACLVEDGNIIAAAQNERFTRLKHDPRFPIEAINYCLEEAKCDDGQIDHIAFYEDPKLVLDRISNTLLREDEKIAQEIINKIAPLWRDHKYDLKSTLKKNLPNFKGKIHFIEHHQSHAASAFFPSPFSDSAILTIDGVGEWATASISSGKNNKIVKLREMHFPDSLGLFYSTITSFLGFKVNSGEYKVMGLAPYGKPVYVDLILDKLIKLNEDGSLKLNVEYFNFSGKGKMFTSKFATLFKKNPREKEAIITQKDMDIAASVQNVTEKVMLKMASHAKDLTNSTNLCMSGGVALNCVGNGKILKSGLFKNIWIQPASGDAGNALGCALFVWYEIFNNKRATNNKEDFMKGSLLGPSYEKNEIKDFLDLYGFDYVELDETKLPEIISSFLKEGKIFGLLQGRMEYGPRALGARSIIGDPRKIEMQQKMNLKIKFRESFRPFAPVILEDKVSDWFEMNDISPYMLLVAPINKNKRREQNLNEDYDLDLQKRLNISRSSIAAVTHVDYSARVQTVGKNSAPRLKSIIEAFEKKTGVPILINTSFNLRGEPIVCSPMDAYRCMMRSNIDYILLENILVSRNQQPYWPEDKNDWKKNVIFD